MSVHSKVIDTDFFCGNFAKDYWQKKTRKKGRQPFTIAYRRQLLQSNGQKLTQLLVYIVNPFNHVFKWHGYSVPIVARPL